MKIIYKEPYWVKFEWEMSEHHDNQYVTLFDKKENEIFYDFLHKEKYIITVNFKIRSHYMKDDICMVFGKPGKNLGLSYNQDSKTTAFEFWTTNDKDDKFNMAIFKTVTVKEIEKGVTLSIIRNKNKIILYKNFELDSEYEFDGELIEDYKKSAFFLGCSNPDIDSEKHRYYCEMDINHLSFISRHYDIETAKELYESEIHNLPVRKYYKDILFYYDFKFTNNLGIIYDESSNNNFLERVPVEYIK
jgi:hypothetical protein